jgi:hypothetical protein
MAMELRGARLTVLHATPAVDAALLGARLTVLHAAPAVDAALLGARLTVLHTTPAVDAALLGARLTVLHTPLLPIQSNSDVVDALPNSGASSPFKSNWDAKRALK